MNAEMTRVTVTLPRPIVEELDRRAKAGFRNRTQQLEMMLARMLDTSEERQGAREEAAR